MAIFNFFNNPLCLGIVLLIVLLLPQHSIAMAPTLVSSSSAYPSSTPTQPLPLTASDLMANGPNAPTTRLLWDKLLMVGSNEEAIYSILNKLRGKQSNYIGKWPSLRDLILTTDYMDEVGATNELPANRRFLERLQQFNGADNDIDDPPSMVELTDSATPTFSVMPVRKLSTVEGPNSLKGHGIKKNVQFRKQYMSPCHFKICNMGRKRNARYVADAPNY